VVICLEVRCRLAYGPADATATQIGFTFLVSAHPGSPRQRAVKWVCVCVCASNCRISCIPLLPQVPPRQPTGFPTLLGHLASSDLVHPLYVLPVKSDGRSLSSVYRPLSSPAPCDVHVVNLRTMQRVAAAGKTGGRQTALILHRAAVDCSFPLLQSVASCPAVDGKVII